MKKIFSVFYFILLGIISCLGASPIEVEIGDFKYTLNPSTQTATLTDALNQDIEVANIPISVHYDGLDYIITALGERSFTGLWGLREVNIPETVTLIDEWAFYSTSHNLKEIYIPSSVKTIKTGAFGLTNISKVEISSLEDWCNIKFYDSPSNPLYEGKAQLYINGELLVN